jgi:hypothetical protein
MIAVMSNKCSGTFCWSCMIKEKKREISLLRPFVCGTTHEDGTCSPVHGASTCTTNASLSPQQTARAHLDPLNTNKNRGANYSIRATITMTLSSSPILGSGAAIMDPSVASLVDGAAGQRPISPNNYSDLLPNLQHRRRWDEPHGNRGYRTEPLPQARRFSGTTPP